MWLALGLLYGLTERLWWIAGLDALVCLAYAYMAWAARRRRLVAPDGVRVRHGGSSGDSCSGPRCAP